MGIDILDSASESDLKWGPSISYGLTRLISVIKRRPSPSCTIGPLSISSLVFSSDNRTERTVIFTSFLSMATFSPTFAGLSSLHFSSRNDAKSAKRLSVNCAAKSQGGSSSQNSGGSYRKVWRRRKLINKDEMLNYKMERVPFVEEQIRKIKEGGALISMDIHRLLLSEDNRFDFVNEVAAEAKQYVENNRDEYFGKKAILHVLSNRMNDAGFYRPEAYMEEDPYKPGPGYLREELDGEVVSGFN